MSKVYKGQTLKEKKRKKLRIFLKILLAFLVIVLMVFSALSWYVYTKMSKLNYVKLDNIQVNEGVELKEKGYRNIALFGVDTRTNTYSNSRSDCIIIASINEDTKNVKLTSVYRDTYVYIEGHGYDKLTHAYAYGGPELAINTLNKNFDLDISEFVTVNFDAVIEIIDAIGGISINIESYEIESINACIEEVNQNSNTNTKKIKNSGMQNLNGGQALGYARVRNTAGGDYKRTERMRDVLNVGFAKIKTLDIGTLNRLADILLPKVYTNITSTEILSLIPQATQYNIKGSIGWPYEIKGITLDRWYGVPVTLESNVQKLHEELFNQNGYEVTDTVKKYSNDIIKKTGYK